MKYCLLLNDCIVKFPDNLIYFLFPKHSLSYALFLSE